MQSCLRKLSSRAKVFLTILSNSSHQKYMRYDSAQLAGTQQITESLCKRSKKMVLPWVLPWGNLGGCSASHSKQHPRPSLVPLEQRCPRTWEDLDLPLSDPPLSRRENAVPNSGGSWKLQSPCVLQWWGCVTALAGELKLSTSSR